MLALYSRAEIKLRYIVYICLAENACFGILFVETLDFKHHCDHTCNTSFKSSLIRQRLYTKCVYILNITYEPCSNVAMRWTIAHMNLLFKSAYVHQLVQTHSNLWNYLINSLRLHKTNSAYILCILNLGRSQTRVYVRLFYTHKQTLQFTYDDAVHINTTL